MADPQILIPEVPLSARASARDGWLFIAIGQFSIVIGILVLIFLKEFGPDDVMFVGFGVSAATWCVLTGMGVFKLVAARHQGARVLNSIWSATLVYGLCALALTVLIAFVHDAIGAAALNNPWAYCAVPVLLVGGFLFVQRFFPTASLAAGALRYSLIAMLLFGLGFAALLSRIGIWNGVPLSLSAAEISALIELCAWQIFGWLALYRRVQASRAGEKNFAPSLLNWMHALLTIEIATMLYPFESISGYAAMLALAPSLAATFLIGRWLAYRRAQPSRLRIALFCAPLATFALLVFIPAAGMTATLLRVSFRGWSGGVLEFRYEWSHQLPEFMRAAFTRTIAALGPKYDAAIYSTGLPPTAELKARALAPVTAWSGNFPWDIWRERDPQDALYVALSVPVQSLPGVPETSYDERAGAEIGHYGTLEEVRKRLSGPYSNELRMGVAAGLKMRPNAEMRELFDDILRCIHRCKNTPQDINFVASLVHALPADPRRACEFVKDCINDPTPMNLVALKQLRFIWAEHKTSHELLQLALKSDHVEVRSAAICPGWELIYHLKSDASGELLERVIAVAEGTLPSSNVTEQRYAICVLREYLGNGFGTNVYLTTPLSQTEIIERDDLCARARKKLKH